MYRKITMGLTIAAILTAYISTLTLSSQAFAEEAQAGKIVAGEEAQAGKIVAGEEAQAGKIVAGEEAQAGKIEAHAICLNCWWDIK
jgi:hypothetical protein